MRLGFVIVVLTVATHLSAQDPGDDFFSQWTVHEIRFQFNQPAFWDSLTANYTQDAYMRADVAIDGQVYTQSGVKYKGNSSYNNPGQKKPFRIDLAEYVEDQAHDGLKKWVLNNGFKDPTLLREKILLDFFAQQGLAAPRCAFARLYINGAYRGLYTVVEDVNKTFLKDRFDNKDGNLFKGDPKGTLVWKGPDQTLYQGDYELKTNEEENNWADLIQFIDVLNNVPPEQLADSLPQYINVDSWIGYWAAQNLFVNLDSYIGSGHNYFIYHNTDTGLFEWIPWDVNEAFANFQMGIPLNNLKTLPFGFIPMPANQRPMMNRLWPQNVWKQALADRLCEMLEAFDNTRLDSRVDSLANLIRDAVYADPYKFYTNPQFEQNLTQDITAMSGPGLSGIAGLKPFIQTRRNSLLQQLAPYGCSASAVQSAPAAQPLVWYPNPCAGTRVSARLPEGVWPKAVRLYRVNGQYKTPVEWVVEDRFVHVQLPESAVSGIYFIEIQANEGVRTERLTVTK